MISIFKVGGGILENKNFKKEFLEAFHKVEGKKILIHGGGRTASEFLKALKIPVNMVNGRRLTDKNTLDVVNMVYNGMNKSIVATLISLGEKAVGCCGADFNLIQAKKREVKEIDYGWVGDVTSKSVNTTLIEGLLKQQVCMVIAPITHDGNGNLLNTNADTMASVIAQALSEFNRVRLFYAFEKPGLLKDSEDENSLIPIFTSKEYIKAKNENFIHSGMIPKLDNCFDALQNGVEVVKICHFSKIHEPESGTDLILN